MSNLLLDTELWPKIVKDIENSSLVREGSYIVYESLNMRKERVIRAGIVKAVGDNLVTITRSCSMQRASAVAGEKERFVKAGQPDSALSMPSLSSKQQHLQRIEAARESVSKILDSQITELFAHSFPPPKYACLVVRSVVDIMCIPMRDNSWDSLQDIFQQEGFIQRITLFDANSLSYRQREDVIQRFEYSEINDELSFEVPQVIKLLLEWIWAHIELFKLLNNKEDCWDELSMLSCRSHWSDSIPDSHEKNSCQMKKTVPHLLNSPSFIEETLLRSAILNVYSCNPPDYDPAIFFSEKLWRPELMECLQKQIAGISTRHTQFHGDSMTCTTEETPPHEIPSENSAKLKHVIGGLEDKLSMQNLESHILAGCKSGENFLFSAERVENEMNKNQDLHEANESLMKSHYHFVFLGDACTTEMNSIPNELRKAFECEVAQCCGVPREHVINVGFSARALRVDFDILHSAALSTEALRERLRAHELSIVRLFDANFGGHPRRMVEPTEDACRFQADTTQPEGGIPSGPFLGDAAEWGGDTFPTQLQGLERNPADSPLIEFEKPDTMVRLSDALDCVQSILNAITHFEPEEKEAFPQTNAPLVDHVDANEAAILAALEDYKHRFETLVHDNNMLREKISASTEENAKLKANNDQLHNELVEVKNRVERFYKSTSTEFVNAPSAQETRELATSNDIERMQSPDSDRLHTGSDENTKLCMQQQTDINISDKIYSAKESFLELSGDLDLVSQVFCQKGVGSHDLAKFDKFIKRLKSEVKNFARSSGNINSSQKERVLHEGEETSEQMVFLTSGENSEVVCDLSRDLTALRRKRHEISVISPLHNARKVHLSVALGGLNKGGTSEVKGEALAFYPDDFISSSDTALHLGEDLGEASSSKAGCRVCARLEENALQYKHYCHRIEWCYTETKKLNDMLLEQVRMLKTSKV